MKLTVFDLRLPPLRSRGQACVVQRIQVYTLSAQTLFFLLKHLGHLILYIIFSV